MIQRVIQRLVRRYYTGLLCILCTFIVTYVCLKGTCHVTGNSSNKSPRGQNDAQFRLVKDTNQNAISNILKVSENESIVLERAKRTNANEKLEYNNALHNTIVHSENDPNVPITRISFLKVHKAGSSTIQNILFRFGLARNLTFALPRRGHYVYGHDQLLPVKDGGQYDIYACHTGYHYGGFNVSTGTHTNLAITREPLKRMVSAAFYYRDVLNKPYLQKVPRDKFIQNLINHPEIYDREVFSRTRNSMGSDFGFSKTLTRHDTKTISSYMSYLKKKFKLVLVMGRFDESLVLLKRKYHWSLRDIIYVKSNTHGHPRVNLTTEEIKKFKEISFMDYQIYDTFIAVFDSEIRQMGEEFQSEVTHFKKVIRDVSEFCRTAGPGTGMEVEWSKWNDGFEVLHNDCILMKMEELEFVQNLKVRHRHMNGLEA